MVILGSPFLFNTESNEMKTTNFFAVLAVVSIATSEIRAQNDEAQIHGNVQWDAQYYNEDSLIGAPVVPEAIRSSFRGDLTFNKGDFSAGMRFESYQKVLQGFDSRFDGNAIMYRFAQYNKDGFDVTIGSFYEQFGSGIVLRTYYEPTLGYDSFLDGARIKYSPKPGIELKGVIGRQRFYMDYSPGTVRGLDGEIDLKSTVPFMTEWKTRVIVGASIVNKYQESNDLLTPGNVLAHAARLKISRGNFLFNAEYAQKGQDPSFDNKKIYKYGNALLMNMSYFKKGLGAFIGIKRVDNMSFRSGRAMFGLDPMINFHPALTKQHLYALANFYPYATQPNGEFAINGELGYRIKKKTLLGGKYGTKITVNASFVNAIQKDFIEGEVNSIGGQEYTSSWSLFSDSVYFRDYSVEIYKKFSKKFKAMALYTHQDYNMDVVQGLAGRGIIDQDIFVFEGTYKLTSRNALIVQLQNLTTDKEEGSWGFGMVELTLAPNWFFAVVDQWNYGNEDPDKKIHYLLGSFGYSKNTTRVQFSYGRQRQGITCVGGVCRFVPASNGLSFTLTSSF